MDLSPLLIEELARAALTEDFGTGRDVTSTSVLPTGAEANVILRAREDGVLSGLILALSCFANLDSDLDFDIYKSDGEGLKAGEDIAQISGSAHAILGAERSALNFLSHLSGIASETACYVDAIAGTGAAITCTRKTLPGLRAIQKYAVRCGGGQNHRFGLDDAILIKDNHIAIGGGVDAALTNACANAGHMMKIEIEVDDFDQLNDVLVHGGADIVMLDNFTPEDLTKAVKMVDGALLTEASGNVNRESVRAIAESGVDLISIGALTHSVRALDIGLDTA